MDLNPACDLCGDPGLDFNFVPEPNRNKLSDTGCCGHHTCEMLYYGASEGTLTSNLCAIIQENSGPDCCNLDILEPPSIDSDDDDEDGEEEEEDDDEIDDQEEENQGNNEEDIENDPNEEHNEGDEDQDQEEESQDNEEDVDNDCDGENDEDETGNQDQEEENQDNEEDVENNEDDESDCKDDPAFLFKGRIGKDCEWLASRGSKKKKKVCKRKSFGRKVWKYCPQACGKCLPLGNIGI